MIRLLEDCDANVLFRKGHPEALRRYWVFTAYSGPCYFVTDEQANYVDNEDEYIESFLYPGHNFIDIGKFDLAFPFFQMDEWTSVIGFVSQRERAPEIASFISEHDTNPEEIAAVYPDIELLYFLWIDGWWEIYGDINAAFDLVDQSHNLAWIDTTTSIYLNENHDKEAYSRAREELQRKIDNRKKQS